MALKLMPGNMEVQGVLSNSCLAASHVDTGLLSCQHLSELANVMFCSLLHAMVLPAAAA